MQGDAAAPGVLSTSIPKDSLPARHTASRAPSQDVPPQAPARGPRLWPPGKHQCPQSTGSVPGLNGRGTKLPSRGCWQLLEHRGWVPVPAMPAATQPHCGHSPRVTPAQHGTNRGRTQQDVPRTDSTTPAPPSPSTGHLPEPPGHSRALPLDHEVRELWARKGFGDVGAA